ncbi:hypothetical protein HNY73_006779 [Argiope bruennichi]|uniref:Uncharacterized protein n=1 Tax=Argiope bruennichi TaxID=94029 RepID=A0A8T0FIZ0_ARGBR|nr:hypothetical protein HNY73_006779 [Argiope bruennichi]
MKTFNIFLIFCLLITISSLVSACPPCKDRRGEKEYCVKSTGSSQKTCVRARGKGAKCSDTKLSDGSYDGLPPCEEGLKCSEEMGGRCA